MAKKPTVIKTEKLGQLSYTKLNKLVKEAGSQAGLAEQLGVPSATVRGWTHQIKARRS